MANELVTIAIPTRNRASLLKRAVDSALAQTHPQVEVIVSDNASSDNTAEVLPLFEQSGVRVLRQATNVGMIGNWNACLSAARGRFFVLLSDDDWLEPTFVETLVDGLRDSTVGFAWCSAALHAAFPQHVSPSFSGPPVESGLDFLLGFLSGRRSVFPCNMLFRTNEIRSLGGYPIEFPFAGDGAIWMKRAIQPGTNIRCYEQELAHYTSHQQNLSNSIHEVLADDLRLVSFLGKVTSSNDIPAPIRNKLEHARHVFAATSIAGRISHGAQLGLHRRSLLRLAWTHRRALHGGRPISFLSLFVALALPPKLALKLRSYYRALRWPMKSGRG